MSELWSYLWLTVGAAIYAVAFNWFFEPNSIAYGGVTGIAQIINVFLPQVGIGTFIICLNLPLFLLGWKFLGGTALVKSLYTMAVSSVMIDLLAWLVEFAPMDPLLASLYGGVLLGLSLGMVFRQGATTGGTDLAASLLKLRLAWLPLGKLLMVLDLMVITAAAMVFGRLDSALYGIVGLVISTFVIDKVLYGLDDTKVAYIISDHVEEIKQVILVDMDRSATLIRGVGAYSGQDKNVILCAFKQKEIVTLKKAVKDIDPSAFMIVCQANEVLGDGFRAH